MTISQRTRHRGTTFPGPGNDVVVRLVGLGHGADQKAHIFWVKSAMIWPGWDGIEGADMGTMGAYLQDQFVARTS